MFKFNADQVQGMETDALEAFLIEMEGWAVRTYGPLMATQPTGIVRREVVRARELGFVLRGHAKRWLALGFELGFPFAATGKAALVAADTTMTPAVRLDILEREGIFAILARDEDVEEFRHAV